MSPASHRSLDADRVHVRHSELLTVRDALHHYYREHGLPADGGATDPSFLVRIGPLRLRLPNPPARRRAVFFHDVNHVAAGYNTRFGDGEVVIAAFEIGAGCGRFGIAWYINLCMFAIGLGIQPRVLLRAFTRGRRSRSVYTHVATPEQIAGLRVAELRRELRLDTAPAQPGLGDYMAFGAWGLVAMLLLLAHVLVPIGVVAALRTSA